VPLRPIHRAGFLLWGAVFAGFSIGIVVGVISNVKHENVVIQCLLLALMVGWFVVLFPLGRRMIWSALTAPSESGKEDEENGGNPEGPASRGRDSN
jgi:galactitol-specific phosphotransferase system IIC component